MPKWSILNFSKVNWDINTKFSPVVHLNSYPLCTKFEGLGPTRPMKVFTFLVGNPNFDFFFAKQDFIEVYKWWKFGADISIHFWEIQN